MEVITENIEGELNAFSLNVLFRGEKINLRAKEKHLLNVLIKSSPACVPRDKIAEEVWKGCFVSDFTINQTINSLRRKINDSGRLLIKTKPREGYVIDKDIAELFSFDKDDVIDVLPEDPAVTDLTVAGSYLTEDKTLSNLKIKSKLRKKAVQRAFILMSLLSACGMAGVGVGSISGIVKDKKTELYLDGVKFIFHQNHVEYINHHNKKIKCSLLKGILDDGEVVVTNTTRCEA